MLPECQSRLDDLVRLKHLTAESSLPLVFEPTVKTLHLVAWLRSQRTSIERQLMKYGAILFRNFDVPSTTQFELLITVLAGEPMRYRERSSPRTQVSGNIYTSTEHPADQTIFLHNEHSYAVSVPLKIFFFCDMVPDLGGETPLADTRKILRRIDPAVRDRFVRTRWMYVRNFGSGIGLPWQTAFQTDDRAEVESYCRSHGIEVEWKEGDGLRTRQVRPALARHPSTGELIWFNHITFFHVSTLPPEVRDPLLTIFAEGDLPNNTYYGDGSPIEPEVLDHLREAYQNEKVVFPWHKGDVLMLDNMLTAHGREPFTGARRVLVGMADPYSRNDL